MKLSTKSRYGIRALIDLSKNYNNKPVSVKEISKRQKISDRYLENIFNDLRNAGILGSVKGKGGGFYLEKPVNEITILEIIDILEGDIRLVTCDDDNGKCVHADICYTRGLWKTLNDKLRDSMNAINLVDILDVGNQIDKCDE